MIAVRLHWGVLRNLMMLRLVLLWPFLWMGCLAEPPLPEGKPMPDHGKITLPLPRDPVADETLKLNITVGSLPRGARIIVRSGRGELLGSISPFGKTGNRPRVSYVLPVPGEEILKRKLILQFSLEDSDKKVRVPTDAEVLEIKLQQGS